MTKILCLEWKVQWDWCCFAANSFIVSGSPSKAILGGGDRNIKWFIKAQNLVFCGSLGHKSPKPGILWIAGTSHCNSKRNLANCLLEQSQLQFHTLLLLSLKNTRSKSTLNFCSVLWQNKLSRLGISHWYHAWSSFNLLINGTSYFNFLLKLGRVRSTFSGRARSTFRGRANHTFPLRAPFGCQGCLQILLTWPKHYAYH